MSPTDDLSPAELRSILAAVPATVILIGDDRTIRFISRLEEGYTHADVLGVPALDFVQPDFQEDYGAILDGVFESGEPAEYEIATKDANGGTQWHAGSLSPVVKDGRVTSVVVVSTNVTERRRAQKEAEKLRRLVPVCSWCKKVRDDTGYWSDLEEFIEEASDSRVTHSMCPDCQKKVVENGLESA